MSLEKAKLDNGLTLYVDQVPGADTTSTTMFVPYGSVNEGPHEEGAAHALEHCVFISTDRFPGPQEIEDYDNVHGIDWNADTYYTRTAYYANAVEVEPCFVHLSEVLQHTKLPRRGIERDMNAVRREASERLDDSDDMHEIAADNAMFGVPHGRAVIGHRDKLRYGADRLSRIHKQQYGISRMALIVVGMANVDQAAELAMRYFEPDGQIYDASDSVLSPPTLGEHHTTGLIREQSRNVRLKMSYPLSAEFREQMNYNLLAHNIAIDMMSRATLHTLRYKNGISYDGAMDTEIDRHPDAWNINAHVMVDGDDVDTARDLLDDVFSWDSSQYAQESLLGSIARYDYSFKKESASLDERTDFILNRLARYREPESYREAMHRLASIGIDDVRDAIDTINEYTQQTPRYVHLTGDRAAIGDVDRIIELDEIA